MKMERTSVPGIYLRGRKYILTYRDPDGVQRKESFPTLKEAKAAKARRHTQMYEGTYQPESHKTLHHYADEWLRTYDGIRPITRDCYTLGLRYAKEFFSPKVKLTAISPKAIADYVYWLKTEKNLAPGSVAKYLAPLRCMYGTAMEHGVVRMNPCTGVRLPRRPALEPHDRDHEDDEVRVFTRDQLDFILTSKKHPLLLELLACTGLRISEALALQWRHLELANLDDVRPLVKVRRGIVKGNLGPPKSRNGRRDVSLPSELSDRLREASRGLNGDDLVFPSKRGTYLDPNSLRRDMLKPVCTAAGCPWAGFHTFRHTFASLHIERGTNLVALSRVMGHHSPAFTLRTYAHLIPGGEAPALELDCAPDAAPPISEPEPELGADYTITGKGQH